MKNNYSDFIIYENNHYLVYHKQEGLASQEDINSKENVVTLTKDYLKTKYNKPGNVYVGLIHRLDKRVSGVMVIGKTSKATARLSESIRNKQFKKTYRAIVVGSLLGEKELHHKLEKVNKTSVESNNGLESSLKYKHIKEIKIDEIVFSVLEIELITGRFNQIRSQLSLINHPIINDFKYGYRLKNYDDTLGLVSISLEFIDPITKIPMVFYRKKEFNNGWQVHLEGEENE